ncbi:hypothetical protein ACFHYQ_21635 [Sphaerimonospora cavernae]|uniref:Bacterial transcriptional activator domain-containing protein n=1 Tax=Sphaerimonospora cavernae TaxID=1740611 RepID=A0ABV6U9N8_9ACTN
MSQKSTSPGPREPLRRWPESAGERPRGRGATNTRSTANTRPDAGARPDTPGSIPSRPADYRPFGQTQRGAEARRDRRPVRIPSRRRARDIFSGLGALLALVGLVGGVPYALIRLAGPPLSPELLNLDLLTSRVGPEAIIGILVLLVWLAWFQLFLCVIVEVYGGLRRVGMPARVPLSGGPQALAHRLVSAALLLFTVTAMAVPFSRATAPAPASIQPQVTAQTAALSAPVAAEAEQAPLHAREVKKVYVVQPPHGRHHESLWEIAEKCLGEGRRYPEIYRLNKHKVQPDGSRLHIADLIRPGWVLDMPDDARNIHIVPVDEERPEILKEHRDKPAELDGRTQYTQPDSADAGHAESRTAKADTARPDINRLEPGRPQHDRPQHKPSLVTPPPAASEPTATATVHPTAAPAEKPPIARSADGQGESGQDEAATGLELLDYLAAATLAGAGLLAVLGRRRREQLWRRAFGWRIARPQGDAADAEVAIRLGADAPGSRMLDLGLRLLGRLLAERGAHPPTIYAAHLSDRGLDLWIHPADENAPQPWEACDGGQVWRLPTHEGRRIDGHALADVPAPYPGLVSLGIGQDGGRVLVDLEAAHGLISMTGANTVAALSALAVELATNRWSDDMRITLVGFGEELTALAPERIRTAGSLAEVLPELESTAAEAGSPDGDARPGGDVLTGRIHGRVADPAWTPHYLLSAIRPDDDEARRLAVLGKGTMLDKGRRTANGFVLTGEVPHATWTWEITETGRARLDALGFEVDAHLLPRRHYDAVVDLVRTAQQAEGEPLTISGGAAERLPDEPPEIEVRILGAIEITSVEPLEEGRAALAHEMVVYLATHPEGVHPVVLGGVLWPRGVQKAVRDATITRVAEWLGSDSRGRPHLLLDDSGRLRLGPGIRTDWRLFQDLVRRAVASTGSEGEAEAVRLREAEAELLDRALRLVRGPLLNGRPGKRYAWLAADPLEYDVTAWVADAAHALCEIRLGQGDPDAAMAAARAGLLLAADDEGLWRDMLRAAHATGDLTRLRAVADGLGRRAASHPYGGGMASETEALIDELLPSWRRAPAQDLPTSRLA